MFSQCGNSIQSHYQWELWDFQTSFVGVQWVFHDKVPWNQEHNLDWIHRIQLIKRKKKDVELTTLYQELTGKYRELDHYKEKKKQEQILKSFELKQIEYKLQITKQMKKKGILRHPTIEEVRKSQSWN